MIGWGTSTKLLRAYILCYQHLLLLHRQLNKIPRKGSAGMVTEELVWAHFYCVLRLDLPNTKPK